MSNLTAEQILVLNDWARTQPALRAVFEYTSAQGVPGRTSNGLGDRLAADAEPARSAGFINPADADIRQIHITDKALTVTSVKALIEGDTSQSVTFEVRYGTDITATGTEIVSKVTTNNTSGEEFTVDVDIPAGSIIWAVITTVVATVRTFSVTLDFT